MFKSSALILLITFQCMSMCISRVACYNEEDRLFLNPIELIDLVRKERKHKKQSFQKLSTVDMPYNDQDRYDMEDKPAELDDDDKLLKDRKMWSRWSKWGECSVTCGGGTISRHRQCVAGRCALGEREEQHRPCLRAPCLIASNITDDTHELE